MHPLFRFFFQTLNLPMRKAGATCLLLAWLMVEVGALEMVARFGDEDVVGRGAGGISRRWESCGGRFCGDEVCEFCVGWRRVGEAEIRVEKGCLGCG